MRVCDDYEKDGKPTDVSVKLHSAVYEVTLREAATGKEFAKDTITATADDCPFLVSSDDTDYYETNDEAIVKFATPYVKT